MLLTMSSGDGNPVPMVRVSEQRIIPLGVTFANVHLSREDLDRIDRVSPKGVASGLRYDAAMLDLVNH